MMSRPEPPAALVTGASSGIGEALAKGLAARGYRLILASENGPELQRVHRELTAAHPVEARCLVEDLAASGAAERLLGRCRELGWPVEVLVNCAGILVPIERELAEPASAERLLALHVLVPTRLCLELGAKMIERGKGYILNVASISALFPDPSSLTYGPSKRYLMDFSRSLRLAWREHGVRVCCLAPGGVRTPFFDHNEVYVPGMVTRHLYPVDKCAAKALQALFRGRGRLTPGLKARLDVLLFRVLLTPAFYGFTKRLYFRLKEGGRKK